MEKLTGGLTDGSKIRDFDLRFTIPNKPHNTSQKDWAENYP
jgi:S-ribosylhomocysteine lyase LuxS involved in autoinducer biosynthesis